MNELQNKKISVLLILFSFLGLLTSFLIKEPYDYGLQIYYEKNSTSMPLTEYCVNFLFVEFNLRRLVIFFVIVFGLGLYTFLYKNDEEIKKFTKSITVLKKTFLQNIFNSIKTFFTKLFKGNFSLYSKNKSKVQSSYNDIETDDKKLLSTKPSQKQVVFFMFMYILPVILIVFLTKDYLDKSYSNLDKLKLASSYIEKINIRADNYIGPDNNKLVIYREALLTSNPFSEVRVYKNLDYALQVLKTCGTLSLAETDRQFVKDYVYYDKVIKLTNQEDNISFYNNLAYFTIILTTIFILKFLIRRRHNRYFVWFIFMISLYCMFHTYFIKLTHATQKEFDKTLTEKTLEGCLQ